MEAFMNEMVTIVVNPAQDPDEPTLVQVGVNGVNQFIPRGHAIAVKRKYVEVLARAKRTDFRQNLDERMNGKDMRLLSDDEMRANRLNWRDDNGVGVPTHLVHGLTTGSLHLWPIPEQDGLIRLTAQRLPIKPLRNPGDKPEIRRELHPALVDWMLYRAYSREDTDLYNDTKAAVALGRFEAEFGRKASGRNEQWVRDGAGVLPGPIA